MDTLTNPTDTTTSQTLAPSAGTNGGGPGTTGGSSAQPAGVATIDAPQAQPEPQPRLEPPVVPLPLNVFLIGPDMPITVTLTRGDVDAVILGRVDTASVELVRDGRIVREPDTLLAIPVTDPLRQAELLRAAVSVDVTARRALAETAEQRRAELGQARIGQARTLDEIRDYLIGQYRDDEIDRDVLDAFLDRFDLDAYRPRVRVSYTITGSFEVDSDDADGVESDVRGYLRVDLDRVDDVVDDSVDYQVTVDSVDPVTD